MPIIHRAKSFLTPRTMTIIWELPMESMSSYSRFIMMMMLQDSQRMLHDCQQMLNDSQQGLQWLCWKLNK